MPGFSAGIAPRICAHAAGPGRGNDKGRQQRQRGEKPERERIANLSFGEASGGQFPPPARAARKDEMSALNRLG